jgi:hypothetical protein
MRRRKLRRRTVERARGQTWIVEISWPPAGVLAISATGAVAGVLGQNPTGAGEHVTMSGWLAAATCGPGHYFVLGPDAGLIDPAARHTDQWPQQLTMVFPSDAKALQPGKVTLRGKLYRGKFMDGPTGHAAATVMTEATLV